MANEKQGCRIKEHLKKPLKLTKMIYKFYTAPITKFWFYLVKNINYFYKYLTLKITEMHVIQDFKFANNVGLPAFKISFSYRQIFIYYFLTWE